jgi:adenine-specific DNA-methyltransferase
MQAVTQPPSQVAEDPRYLQDQLITYLGNKRALLPLIGHAVEIVRNAVGGRRLTVLDIFSGTGVVSRYMKQHADLIIANDLEAYSRVTNQCYLTNLSDIDWRQLADVHEQIVAHIANHPREGFIRELYAPKNENRITRNDRVFYTSRNAAYLDSARAAIGEIAPSFQPLFLAPLLAEASVHVNTSGVFKGFYKNARGTGQYGGHGRNALQRIMGEIALQLPVLSRHDCRSMIYQEDANTLAPRLPKVDLAYLDPPYNQHPYGSNYFLLNLLVEYKRPSDISPVSGIPTDWKRSRYNQRREAADALFELIANIRAKYCLISYNSEGFIPHDEFLTRLAKQGEVQVCQTSYNTFRGSRNLRERPIHVTEFLYLVKK